MSEKNIERKSGRDDRVWDIKCYFFAIKENVSLIVGWPKKEYDSRSIS